MKAYIFDYTDGSILVLPIPKEWEENVDDFVTAHPCYDSSSCYYMSTEHEVEVYEVVKDGEDEDGYPCYDYNHINTI